MHLIYCSNFGNQQEEVLCGFVTDNAIGMAHRMTPLSAFVAHRCQQLAWISFKQTLKMPEEVFAIECSDDQVSVQVMGDGEAATSVKLVGNMGVGFKLTNLWPERATVRLTIRGKIVFQADEALKMLNGNRQEKETWYKAFLGGKVLVLLSQGSIKLVAILPNVFLFLTDNMQGKMTIKRDNLKLDIFKKETLINSEHERSIRPLKDSNSNDLQNNLLRISLTEQLNLCAVQAIEKENAAISVVVPESSIFEEHYILYYRLSKQSITRPVGAFTLGRIGWTPEKPLSPQLRLNIGKLDIKKKQANNEKEYDIFQKSSNWVLINAIGSSAVVRIYGENGSGFAFSNGVSLKLIGRLMVTSDVTKWKEESKECQTARSRVEVLWGRLVLYVCDKNTILLVSHSNSNYRIVAE